MNIGIDARLLRGRVTGINRYLRNVLLYLPEYDKENKYFLYMYEGTNFQNDFYTTTLVKVSKLPRQIYEHYWLNFVLPGILEEQKIDIFFSPYLLLPAKKGNRRNVMSLLDSVTKSCRNSYKYHYIKYMDIVVPWSIKRSDVVLTISESARQDIIKNFNADPAKVSYMHLWTDEKYHPRDLSMDEKERLRKKYGLPEKFVLYIGTIEQRKNITGILKISDLVKSKKADIKFVLIGRPGFGFEEINREMQLRKENVQHIKYVEENDLPLMYNLAHVFLFPSMYEGFGLPPLEAMKSGIPAITSNRTSLPEVMGDGLMSDPDDYSFYAENIIRLFQDQAFYEKIRNEGLLQAEKFVPGAQIPKLINIFNSLRR